MKLLLVTSDLGFNRDGSIRPGGLQQFGRCVARALASCPEIEELDVFAQTDPVESASHVERMLGPSKHSSLCLRVRTFQNRRAQMAWCVFRSGLGRRNDRVMYTLINQGVLSLMPSQPPAVLWQIGAEVAHPLSWLRCRALRKAGTILSISHRTTAIVTENHPQVALARVVHLCVEPPLFQQDAALDPASIIEYDPERRIPAVLIVGTVFRAHLYKGHRQLIASWPYVTSVCPEAQLWIAGDGDAAPDLKQQAQSFRPEVNRNIKFLGAVTPERLHELFCTCRVFAMPSSGEGFGLVFVEAARYGIPCIGGKYDSVAEVVLDNETGLLVEKDPYEIALACLKVLTKAELAKRLGEAARQRYLSTFRFSHFRDRLRAALGFSTSA